MIFMHQMISLLKYFVSIRGFRLMMNFLFRNSIKIPNNNKKYSQVGCETCSQHGRLYGSNIDPLFSVNPNVDVNSHQYEVLSAEH